MEVAIPTVLYRPIHTPLYQYSANAFPLLRLLRRDEFQVPMLASTRDLAVLGVQLAEEASSLRLSRRSRASCRAIARKLW